ncbi:hypothetical protein AJ80_06102 [Polytolypa hystricis UAMH7299]|uniref:BZIP domain-containing protein n=1 Tax=Polytolypa hystricis (strain UAMH7299) TaxID=1447883 RepID=A0A2B7XQB6_POLH7|nr:hypothetical protein AJ80_06102 [Polytolypa hystricis UAMH7299]
MDYRFMSSPSQSPDMLSLYSYSIGQSTDNTSDSSGPGSPDMNQMIYGNISPAYDMLSFDNSARSDFASTAGKIPVEYLGSSTLDDMDRRRRKPTTPKDKETTTNMHLRRRAQNRASQRAFRERKERHVKGLENQLQDLHEKHQDLRQSYTRQADQVQRLNERIQNLTTELDVLRTSSEVSFTDMLAPNKFDLVPYQNMSYTGPEYYFDKDAMKMNANATLSFRDDTL